MKACPCCSRLTRYRLETGTFFCSHCAHECKACRPAWLTIPRDERNSDLLELRLTMRREILGCLRVPPHLFLGVVS